FPISQYDLTHANLTARLQRLRKQGVSLGCDDSVGARVIRRLVERRMHFGRVNETGNFEDLGALELDLRQLVSRDDDELLGLELVPLHNILIREDLAALLTFFLVADRSIILFMQLIEPDR